MYIRSPRLSALYESSVRECEAAGCRLAADDYAMLYQLSRRTVDGGGDMPAFLSPTVHVPGADLHRPGIGMLEWMERVLQPCLEGESDTYWVLGMAWALAHARERDYIASHSTPRSIRRAILAFVASLPWSTTPEELAWGVTAALGGERKQVGRGRVDVSGFDWGSMIAGIANRCRIHPEKIAWEMPLEDVEKLADNLEGQGGDRTERKAWHELRAAVDALKTRAKEKGDGGDR